MRLNSLRSRIDELDRELIALLNRRAGVSSEISTLKRSRGRSVYSPDRESEVLRRIARLNKGPLPAKVLESIYSEIMSYSLSLGGALRIAYLGPEASFTNLAAIKRFGSQVDYVGCGSITDIFLNVQRDVADYGVVPIENSIEGAVSHTMDMFMDSDLKICSQLMLDISHNLLANCPREKIKKIYSISQVFGQCRMWIEDNLPRVEKIEVSSTTRAAEIAASEKYSASISSMLAAKVYKLKVVASSIEDFPHNITRFLVIGKSETAPTGDDRTSIMFSIKDKVGALCDMLAPFKKYGVNLTKIESRPSKKKAWDYYFFVDLAGHKEGSKVKKALLGLENKCKFFKILGSYPV
jgi:chorismate mutase/prephenate dehydratase